MIEQWNIQGGYHFAAILDDADDIVCSSEDAGSNAYDCKSALALLRGLVADRCPQYLATVDEQIKRVRD